MSATTRMSESRNAAPRSRKKYVIGFVALLLFAVFAVVVASNSDPSTVASRADVNHLPVGPKVPALERREGLDQLPPADRARTCRARSCSTTSGPTRASTVCARSRTCARGTTDTATDGLVVVGVHSPEFNFEKNHDNVKAAVTRLHVDYPVALDDDMVIWNEFSNNYWPADYIADRQGRLRDMTIGEGSYTQTEDVLRKLLGVATSAPRASVGRRGQRPASRRRQGEDVTPETYLGLERGIAGAESGVNAIPRPGIADDATRRVWSGAGSATPRTSASTEAGAAIVIEYRAREVNLVMASAAPDGGPIDVRVEVDGKPLPPSYRTSQTMVDADGTTYVGCRRPTSTDWSSDRRSAPTRCGSPPRRRTWRPSPSRSRPEPRPDARSTRSRCSGPASRRFSRRASCRCSPRTSASSSARAPTPVTRHARYRPRSCSCLGFATVFAELRRRGRPTRFVAARLPERGRARRWCGHRASWVSRCSA